MPEFETVLYEERNGVAWVTLNRPEVLHAFNLKMQEELSAIWKSIMRNDDVNCAVLTATGDKAFCVGIDRSETIGNEEMQQGKKPGYVTQWWYDDPGHHLGPKSNELWKPVIAAVNGMACGGAFYFLGEVDFVIAADHATFFDPHVTYGMTAAYEPIHLLQKMPLQEVLRLALLGAHERMSAQKASEVGLVTQVVPKEDLEATATWAAEAIASAPPLVVQGTLRAIWMAQEVPRSQAIELGYLYTNIGTDLDVLQDNQAEFAAGRRVEWRLR
ncbi:MAG: enoyl-CoA hydratase/isomerase family protein [Acidimicrobiales bacterium]|jgi:enoyl-CoA hydratase/carnithine racemase|nr:enoyl-CoA hydratase/isomerase family protein [Acidimicrobiales bacterium]